MYAKDEPPALQPEESPEAAGARLMLEAMAHQTELMEEIRNQFAEHLELQREILQLLMVERHN